ncbi:unnamed protein product [Effrenium voratum]|uniref:Uncharacterized protein n=1 Tax=Effrenium voratum TaxID=2562239 RepID=A0AA36MX40_9DINO|nr:unnamed protein product [Effrenium voratum]
MWKLLEEALAAQVSFDLSFALGPAVAGRFVRRVQTSNSCGQSGDAASGASDPEFGIQATYGGRTETAASLDKGCLTQPGGNAQKLCAIMPNSKNMTGVVRRVVSQALPTLRLAMSNTLTSRLPQCHRSRISTSQATWALYCPDSKAASPSIACATAAFAA